ncbi:MAG: hypothetical protein E6R13_07640 [Spirochaetes bacterium]|nr:MAG: hypothetical protein E6R13_07640 [Spirochaetota bacterium]
MISIDSYNIEGHLYKVGDVHILDGDSLKIVGIVNINATIFFFCERLDKPAVVRIDQSTSIFVSTHAINALIFHKRIVALTNK